MRILTLCRGVYPNVVGGIEIHVHYISNEFSRKHQVAVLHESTQSGSTPGPWTSITIPPQKSGLLYIIRGLLSLLRTRFIPNVIIAHSAYSPLFLGFIVSLLLRAPCILVAHGSDIRIVGRGTWLKYPQRIVMRSMGIIAVSEEIKNILVEEYRIGQNSIRVIPNGFDSSLLASQPKETWNGPLIVFIGSLKPEKDPMTAIISVHELRDRLPQVRMKVVGMGPLKEQVDSCISKLGLDSHVELLGQLSHAEAMKVLVQSDVFVLSSIHEGLPVALVEAMAAAKPIVASDLEAVGDLIVDGIHGLLFPQRDSHALAQSILLLASDKQRARRMGLSARDNVRELSWDRIARKQEEFMTRRIGTLRQI